MAKRFEKRSTVHSSGLNEEKTKNEKKQELNAQPFLFLRFTLNIIYFQVYNKWNKRVNTLYEQRLFFLV